MTKPKKQKKLSRPKVKTLDRFVTMDASKNIIHEFENFPVDHYSYSSWLKFSTNPFMFKVNNINGDQLDTTNSPGNIIGKAAHKALQAYFGGADEPTPQDEGAAIKFAHEHGIEYLKSCSEGFIEYTEAIPNRSKIDEKFAQSFFGYIKEFDRSKIIKEVLLVEKMLQFKIQIGDKVLPIPLKGSADLVYRDFQDRIIIRDHKFTSRFSDPESIDGAKLIQALFNYYLVYAELGEEPYSMIYEEYKITENRDKSSQIREFEIVFEDHPLIFDLFNRFYDDITNALLGKQVYVPNLFAIFDREVSLLAYIHRLDVDTEREKAFRKLKVDNITDFLKKKIQTDGAMKKYLDVVSKKFISAKTMNYKEMTIEERIKAKLAEHGLGVEFDSKVIGGSVVLYRYEPSIGLKMSKIESFVKDIEQVVEVSGIRVLAPIPNSGLVGFEVPNQERTFPGKSPDINGFEIPIGVNILNEIVSLDIREAPHILIAGTTGSGKSVCMSSIIENVLKLPKSEVHLMDPKMVELAPFSNRSASYCEELDEIRQKLNEFVVDMDCRYKVLQKAGVRNIKELPDDHPMHYRFIFIDEFADIIMQDKHERKTSNKKSKVKKIKLRNMVITEKETDGGEASIEDMIIRLAQKGRAAGLHIIMATQRPSVDIINGVIKANFPTRIAFRTSSAIDSIVIIDQPGAEKLLGKGDMLLLNPAKNGLDRLQGFK